MMGMLFFNQNAQESPGYSLSNFRSLDAFKWRARLIVDAVFSRGTDGLSSLSHAAKEGDNAVVAELIESIQWAEKCGIGDYISTVSVQDVTEEGYTALHWAAAGGHWKIIHLLSQKLPQLFNLNIRDFNNNTALHIAVGQGHLRVVKYVLYQREEAVWDQNFSQDTVLHLAIKQGFVPIVEYISEGKYVRGSAILFTEELIRVFEAYVNDPLYNLSLAWEKHYSSLKNVRVPVNEEMLQAMRRFIKTKNECIVLDRKVVASIIYKVLFCSALCLFHVLLGYGCFLFLPTLLSLPPLVLAVMAFIIFLDVVSRLVGLEWRDCQDELVCFRRQLLFFSTVFCLAVLVIGTPTIIATTTGVLGVLAFASIIIFQRTLIPCLEQLPKSLNQFFVKRENNYILSMLDEQNSRRFHGPEGEGGGRGLFCFCFSGD